MAEDETPAAARLGPSSPERFVDAARAVSLGIAAELTFPPDEIIRIANDSALRRELVSLFRSKIQDPDTRSIVIDYIAELLIEEEHDIETKDTLAEGMTLFVGRPALGVTGAGIAAIVGGVSVGSVVLLSGGLVAMVAVGGGWTYLKLRANAGRKETRRLARLVKDLEKV